ncbi:unnamed protein product [Protopolystoma xenopodis]|uniref:Uncharacterized protein n=1 Tax=Protopolystoma xenopodis TaxID=117903 RepID=A0A3S5A2I2_9PLAT|nr:unnamed protein product [Protopolystoma xenopodis]
MTMLTDYDAVWECTTSTVEQGLSECPPPRPIFDATYWEHLVQFHYAEDLQRPVTEVTTTTSTAIMPAGTNARRLRTPASLPQHSRRQGMDKVPTDQAESLHSMGLPGIPAICRETRNREGSFLTSLLSLIRGRYDRTAHPEARSLCHTFDGKRLLGLFSQRPSERHPTL